MAITLDNLKQKQALLRILVFSFVTVLIWIGFSVFRSQQSTGISPELQKLAIPLNPNIDMTAIERIEQKRAYTDQELSSFPILKIKAQSTNTSDTSTLTTPNGTPVGADLSALINNPNLGAGNSSSTAPSSLVTPPVITPPGSTGATAPNPNANVTSGPFPSTTPATNSAGPGGGL